MVLHSLVCKSARHKSLLTSLEFLLFLSFSLSCRLLTYGHPVASAFVTVADIHLHCRGPVVSWSQLFLVSHEYYILKLDFKCVVSLLFVLGLYSRTLALANFHFEMYHDPTELLMNLLLDLCDFGTSMETSQRLRVLIKVNFGQLTNVTMVWGPGQSFMVRPSQLRH